MDRKPFIVLVDDGGLDIEVCADDTECSPVAAIAEMETLDAGLEVAALFAASPLLLQACEYALREGMARHDPEGVELLQRAIKLATTPLVSPTA